MSEQKMTNEELSCEKASDAPADKSCPAEKKKKRGSFLVRFIQGALVGVGGIIPGISGGVLCAIFGFYEPLIEVISHPVKGLKKHFKLILPVVIGIGFGFLALAKAVELLFKANPEIATALFTGLIIGELPSLWKDAGEHGERKKSSYICLAAAFIIIFTSLLVLELGQAIKIELNVFWYAISGAFLGLGVVIPGMSGSAPLTFLGLYEPLMEIISSFTDGALGFVSGTLSFADALSAMNFAAVIPLGIGVLIPFVLISRPINYCLKKFPSQMFHTIFGVVVATVLPTLIFKIGFGGKDTVIKILFILAGFICAWLIDRVSRKYS